MSALRFDDRVAVITGAGRGLGRAYALELARRGARLVLNDLVGGAGSELTSVVDECTDVARGSAIGVPGDISDQVIAEAAVAAAVDRFGGVDIVVNNAGIPLMGPFDTMRYQDLMNVVRVHLGGHFALTLAAWPHMRRNSYGRVVMTGSNSALFGMNHASGYAAAKGAILGLARSIALEAVGTGITVNIICPSAFTKMAIDTMSPAYAAKMEEFFPAEAVAPVIAWLAHESCTINGAVIDTKGGGVRSEWIAATDGILLNRPTAEQIAADAARVLDRNSTSIPINLADASNWVFAQRGWPQKYETR